MPDDKRVVLGLVSSKISELEPVEVLTARVHEAALSTQCGFASISVGANHISEDTQQRKLELVGQAADQIW